MIFIFLNFLNAPKKYTEKKCNLCAVLLDVLINLLLEVRDDLSVGKASGVLNCGRPLKIT